MVGNVVHASRPFYEMNCGARQHTLAVHGVDHPSEERDEILAIYHELDVFEDVRDGLRPLREGGYPVYDVFDRACRRRPRLG